MWLLMLEFPEITDDVLLGYVQSGRACHATKMNRYYKKLVGGLSCSNIDQIKLTLLMHILQETYKLDLTCFNSKPSDSDRSYLEIFINFLRVECADCGNAFTAVVAEETTENETEGDGVNDELNYILLENGTYITLEDESGSHLMENN